MSATGNDNIAIETGGLDRRTLIKRAAAAGTLAWTAPVVIDSLASPAGALTLPCDCYKVVLDANCTPTLNPNNDCSPESAATVVCSTIVPQNTVANNYTASDFCLSLAASNTGPPASGCVPVAANNFKYQYATVTVGSNCNCDIVAAQAKVVGRGGCTPPSPVAFTPPNKTVTFDKGNTTDTWKSFTMIIKCGC